MEKLFSLFCKSKASFSSSSSSLLYFMLKKRKRTDQPRRHPAIQSCRSRPPYEQSFETLINKQTTHSEEKGAFLCLKSDITASLRHKPKPTYPKASAMASEAPLRYEASAGTTHLQVTDSLPSEVVQCLQNARFVCDPIPISPATPANFPIHSFISQHAPTSSPTFPS